MLAKARRSSCPPLGLAPALHCNLHNPTCSFLAGIAGSRSKTPQAYQVGKALATSLQPQYFAGLAFSAALQRQLAATLADVEVYNHTFPASSRSSRARRSNAACVNVAAVLASRRGDGKESLVLVTPIRHQQHSPGVVTATAVSCSCVTDCTSTMSANRQAMNQWTEGLLQACLCWGAQRQG